MAEHAFAVDLLDIDAIDPNPENYNEGDVGACATTIATTGWHGSILCQDRGKKARPMLFAGETRWRALHALQVDGYTYPNGRHLSYADLLADKRLLFPPAGKVPGQVLPLEDLLARQKLVADNRASALALTNDPALVALLQDLAEQDALMGSLYDGDDLDDLMSMLNAPTLEALEHKFGEPNGSEMWPVLRIKVPHDVRDRYFQLVAGHGDETAQFVYVLELAEQQQP